MCACCERKLATAVDSEDELSRWAESSPRVCRLALADEGGRWPAQANDHLLPTSSTQWNELRKKAYPFILVDWRRLLRRKMRTASCTTTAWACSELAAAASSSTMAEFCWVTESS